MKGRLTRKDMKTITISVIGILKKMRNSIAELNTRLKNEEIEKIINSTDSQVDILMRNVRKINNNK